jgi:hypothetical protein
MMKKLSYEAAFCSFGYFSAYTLMLSNDPSLPLVYLRCYGLSHMVVRLTFSFVSGI